MCPRCRVWSRCMDCEELQCNWSEFLYWLHNDNDFVIILPGLGYVITTRRWLEYACAVHCHCYPAAHKLDCADHAGHREDSPVIQCSVLGWKRVKQLRNFDFCNIIPWPRNNSCEKRVCGNVWFPHGCLDVSYGSWDKSKNPCPCANHTFPSEVHHRNLERTQPAASCFPGPDDAPHWEICNFHMGMDSCYKVCQMLPYRLKFASFW